MRRVRLVAVTMPAECLLGARSEATLDATEIRNSVAGELGAPPERLMMAVVTSAESDWSVRFSGEQSSGEVVVSFCGTTEQALARLGEFDEHWVIAAEGTPIEVPEGWVTEAVDTRDNCTVHTITY